VRDWLLVRVCVCVCACVRVCGCRVLVCACVCAAGWLLYPVRFCEFSITLNMAAVLTSSFLFAAASRFSLSNANWVAAAS
jgi:hypothetical protein